MIEVRDIKKTYKTGDVEFQALRGISFTNQVLAQVELWQNGHKYENKVYTLPKCLDEKVASLHLAKVGARLDVLTAQQAKYLGVKPQGPFKPDHYRY